MGGVGVGRSDGCIFDGGVSLNGLSGIFGGALVDGDLSGRSGLSGLSGRLGLSGLDGGAGLFGGAGRVGGSVDRSRGARGRSGGAAGRSGLSGGPVTERLGRGGRTGGRVPSGFPSVEASDFAADPATIAPSGACPGPGGLVGRGGTGILYFSPSSMPMRALEAGGSSKCVEIGTFLYQ